ncbi:hypothetical protein TNCV_5017651 [Trichonephila clavipes]|nr:hypothetical protein TNCV_5017651 [Trichonephila clavipes]
MVHDRAVRRISVLRYRIGWNMAYPSRFIRRRGLVLWPPRSPELSPLDYFPVGQSQVFGVSRRSGCTNGLNCSSPHRLFLKGHCASVIYALIYFTARSRLLRYVRQTL